MRIALYITLGLLLTLHLSALPTVRTGALPAWLYAIHPDLDKKPAHDDISNGYYYELLDLQTNLLQNTEYTHYIKDIANESGVQNASEVSVTFAPQFQRVVFHHISIIRDGAVLDQLDPSRIKVIQEEADAGEFQYNGLKRAFLTLKDVRKGDRIDVAWSVIGFNPVFGHRFSDDFTFTSSTAVCNYYKTIISNRDRPLHILTLNKAPAPAEQHQGNTLVYTWNNPGLQSFESESDAPSWYNKAPTIYVTEYNNWQEVIDWGLGAFDHYHFRLSPGLQQKITGWRIQAKGNKNLFANWAARFVQDEIRYLGLEIGANTHRPHSPNDVFAQRFGDCKDKALLLSAILQQDDIPAYVALISTDTRSQLATIAPSPGAFDHAIVAIRRSKGVYAYVDPTRSGQRGEFNDLYIPDYGYALVLEEGGTGLQPVTPGRINDYTITEHLDARYYDSSRFSVTSIYTGGAADDVREMFAESSRREIEEKYSKYYADLFEDIHQDGPITFTDDSARNQVLVSKHYSVPQLWNTETKGKKSFNFTVQILDQTLPDPSKKPDDVPLALPYPTNIHYTLNLSLPEDWEFGSGEMHIRNDAYQFDFVPSVNGSKMTLHYTLRTFKDNIPAAGIRQYKKDYKNMADVIYFQLYKTIAPEGSTPEETSASKESAPPASITKDWKVCWPAIWLTFFFSLFFSRLFTWLNSRSEETLYAPGTGYPLGGWLVLLGISIGVNLTFEGIQLLRNNYYSYSNWTAFGNAGGTNLQYLLMTELAIHLSFMAGGAAVLFWFLKKRDIFPRMFLWYAGILLSGRLLLILLFSVIPVPVSLNSYKFELTGNLIRTILYAAICITYILRSGQVKSTFLEPFRERIR